MVPPRTAREGSQSVLRCDAIAILVQCIERDCSKMKEKGNKFCLRRFFICSSVLNQLNRSKLWWRIESLERARGNCASDHTRNEEERINAEDAATKARSSRCFQHQVTLRGYSCLRACMGSTRKARRAGTKLAARASPHRNIELNTNANGFIFSGARLEATEGAI